jgi:hypothetical protein
VRARSLAAAAFLSALMPLAAEEASFALGGSIEARPFARFTAPEGLAFDSAEYGSASTLSLDLDARGPGARAYASLEAALLGAAAADDAWAAAGLAFAGGIDSGGILMAPAYDPAAAGDPPPAILQARVRSLYVKIDRDWVSLTAGRQVIKYQRAALWSPTDVYTELDLSGISPVRRGVDALRLSFPLGATGAFDLAAAPGSGFAEGRYSARLSGLVLGIDAAALAYRDGRPESAGSGSWSAGAAIGADLGVGVDAEVLAAWPDSGGAWMRAALGADYSIGRLVLAAEYYYNGGGPEADPAAPGSHNAYAAASWAALDLASFGASGTIGFSARSWSAALSASISAAQNAQLTAYARLSRPGDGLPMALDTGAMLAVKF